MVGAAGLFVVLQRVVPRLEKIQNTVGVPVVERPGGMVFPGIELWCGGVFVALVSVHVLKDIEVLHVVGTGRVVFFGAFPCERLAAGTFMLDRFEAAGNQRVHLWSLQKGATGVAAVVLKGHFLTGLALRVGDFIHVFCNQVADALVRVRVLIAEGRGDGLSGGVGGGRVGLSFESVLHDVLLNGIIFHVRINASEPSRVKVVDLLDVGLGTEAMQMLFGGRRQKEDNSV